MAMFMELFKKLLITARIGLSHIDNIEMGGGPLFPLSDEPWLYLKDKKDIVKISSWEKNFIIGSTTLK